MQYATIPVNNNADQDKQIACAIANPGSSQSITIKLALVGQNGNVVNDTVTIALGPRQQIARYLWQDSGRTNFKGSPVLRGQAGANFIAIGLIDKQGLFTVLPVASGKASNMQN
jgi:hypothetical protein